MLGLRRRTVEIVDHQPVWEEAFERERLLLCSHVGDRLLDIQHVGSTAVPGLDAKPIIDMAAAVESREVIADLRDQICSLGYIDRGDNGDSGGYLFIKESEPDVRTHHLHVVAIDDPQWLNYLRFRDALRTDDSIRREYAELKRALQKEYPQDRASYTSGKHDFIRRVLCESRCSSSSSPVLRGAVHS